MKKLIVILGVAALALVGTSCQKLKARDQLNKGVQAFKNAQYDQAVEHFKTAVELDPAFPTARLYLATAYMNQYIPGAESPENMQKAQAAHDEFMKVLEAEPEEHRGPGFRRHALPPAEEVGRGQAVVREAGGRGPQQQGGLLQPRVHLPGASGIRSTARPAPSWG